ncbi:MAG: hypothetical protein M1826_007597 [Phylliscum demangeonii]|nr:MAG: hypothetical protein M1826_007597 [Phylliscum demangeonii]
MTTTTTVTAPTPVSLPALLQTLTSSLDAASTSLPNTAAAAIVPPAAGISLLDVKNELLLSYLQHLVFLILLNLRRRPRTTTGGHDEDDDGQGDGTAAVVAELVKHRVYLEKGVRPLEGRLKYQLDKVLRAAEEADREANAPLAAADDGAVAMAGTVATDDGDVPAQIDELSYRPNPGSLRRPSSGRRADPRAATAAQGPAPDGLYRPPRIAATAPPITTAAKGRATGRDGERASKSATLDEYIATELSAAPLAEPSIGSTIVDRGRRNKTPAERQTDAERRVYEEANFVRLPKESKKDRAKAGGSRRGDARGGGGYGGEDWRSLGEGVRRIDRLTARPGAGRSAGAGGGAGGDRGRAVLERSRKRGADDGATGAGAGHPAVPFGERLERKRRMLGKRNRTGADYEDA